MRPIWLAIAALALSAACARDPLRNVERLSEVDLPEDAAATAAVPAPSETAAGGGFFSRIFAGARPAGAGLGGPGAGPAGDVPEIAPGTVLPYGTIATVCGLTEGDLGRKVAESAGYALWDSQPGTTAPRAHYLTGMDDRCARQFTAALAIFGDVATHEMVRYLPSNDDIAYTETDSAYEAIKAEVCGVLPRQPCGARSDALARRTVFVSAYEAFGTNPSWAEILLHDGAVAGMSRKEG